jgi:hypothetical protein
VAKAAPRSAGRTALTEVLPHQAAKFLPDASHRHREVSLHQLSLQPEHPIAQAAKRLIAASICRLPPGMIAAIHLEVEHRMPRKPVAAG